jgi:hypothetical protein
MDQLLHRYRAYTLVDITKTDVLSYSQEKEKQRNQQRNWETVIQVLSLRAQLIELDYLGVRTEDTNTHSFGINYSGEHSIWSFEFSVEYENVYAQDNDRYGTLKNDFRIAPIVMGLDETAKPDFPLFYPSGEFKNIYFITVTSD